MKHNTSVYCSALIEDLSKKMKYYKETVTSIVAKYKKDLAAANKAAEEKYPLNIEPDTTLTMFDQDAKRKKKEETETQTKVVNEYRKTYVDAKKETLIPKVVQDVRTAQNIFHEEARKIAKELREKLEDDVASPLSNAFLHYANAFNTFNIPLTEMDLNALITFAEGSSLGYRVIDSILRKTNSTFDFKYKSLDSFNQDIKLIESLATDECFCVPLEYMHEMVELFKGVPICQDQGTDLNSKIQASNAGTFDRTMLASFYGLFEANIEHLEDMFTEADEEDVQTHRKDPYACWLKDATVNEDAPIEIAKEMGQETAKRNQPVTDQLGKMVK